ncbi:MAG TPA: hypothetical protein VFP98_04685 [Candidatus Polarisedimenticolia bacterium]|nr:hypothetical protein [Candidatus Polarisedimenticolia bacterium]
MSRDASSRIAVMLAVAIALAGCQTGGAPGGASTDSAPVPPPSTAGVQGARASFAGFSFEVPQGWVSEQPSSGMRLAQYRIPPAAGDPQAGECALFHFPGQGGTVQANLDRWYGQFEQPDGGSTAERARVETFTAAGGLAVTLTDVSGTYLASMGSMSPMGSVPADHPSPARTGYRMVAGVVETAAGPWFLKCVGPEATMAAAAPSIRSSLQTARP